MTTFANVDIDTFTDAFADGAREYIDQRMAVLEARLAALEAVPTLRYVGVWDATKAYAAGSVTTHDGSAWISKADIAGVRPGTHPDWQLAVKKGRDGAASAREPARAASPRGADR